MFSNEPDNGPGDGSTINDIQGAEPGTPDYNFDLRAERAGGGNGRIYGITFTVSDSAGHATEATCLVGVPHDQSGDLPVDDGPGAGYGIP